MGTLFGNLEIGKKSLLADQLALQVTGNNMANINTPGYSRQRAVLQTAIPVSTAAGLVGSGVDVKTIESVRDPFVELRLAKGTQNSSKQEAIFRTLDQVQTVFPAGDKGLQEGISRFFDSFATLANNPESDALRHTLTSAADSLASTFRSSAQQLIDIQQNVNSSIKDAVTKINTLASNIATLNKEIVSAEASGNEASSLRDQRSLYINQLSELADVQYYQSTDNTFYVSVTRGLNLVAGTSTTPLSASPAGISGFYQIKSGLNDITSKIKGGQLAGLVELRDVRIPTYQSDLDTLADTIINQVNAQHKLGIDLLGNAGADFFNPTPAPAPPASLPSGAALNFSVNPSILADVRTIAASQTDPLPTTPAPTPNPGHSGAPGDNANALALANLINLRPLGNGTQTFSQNYASLQFKVGTDTQSSKRTLDAQGAVLTQLKNQRDSISGVSLDEEAVDLVRFQRAFQASAKFISTIDQLTGEIIQAFGV